MGVIDEVKQKTDIVEIISRYAVLKKAGKNLTALCPFHSEKKPSFFVYPEQQSWHCFGSCNTGGDVFSFLMKQENMDFGEALRMLAEQAGVELPSFSAPDVNKDEKDKLHRVNEAAALYFNNLLLNSPAAQEARAYVEKRELTSKTIADFQLGYSPNGREDLKNYLLGKEFTEKEILDAGLIVEGDDGTTHDRFRNRLMFPIHDNRGLNTGFGGRALNDYGAKYVNSPQTTVFDKSGTIYALHLAASSIRKQEQAVIVEGYMDVITAHQNGLTNVVAAMGTAITERQVLMLKKLTKHIVLALDADSAGEEAMLRCVDYENLLDSEIRVAVLPEGKDPDDVVRESPETWTALLAEAIPSIDFTFDRVLARLDMTKAADQSAAVSTLGAVIVKITDPVRQAFYIQKLAGVTDKEMRVIEAALGRTGQKQQVRKRAEKKTPQPVPPVGGSRIEEECLALLLQHPELREQDAGLVQDFFENTENREIYLAWKENGAPALMKERLDPSLWDRVDALSGKQILATRLDERYNSYILRLKEEHLRNEKRKEASALASAVESGALDLAQLSIESNNGLHDIFVRRAGNSWGKRR